MSTLNPQSPNPSPSPAPFDPYHHWLGISPNDQPPDHYRLLGIERFESDLQVIDSMASRHMEFLQEVIDGPHVQEAQRLLNELAAARRCLLDPERKSTYDRRLKARLAQDQAPTPVAAYSGQAPAATVVKMASPAGKPDRDTQTRADPRGKKGTVRTPSDPRGSRRSARPPSGGRSAAWLLSTLGITAGLFTVLAWVRTWDSNLGRSHPPTIPNRGEFTTGAPSDRTTDKPERTPVWTGPIPGDQLRLWLDASDQTTMEQDRTANIICWQDKSGHACHAKATDIHSRPQWARDLLGNLPAVRFTGSQWLEIPNKSSFLQLGADYAIFFVARGHRGSLLSKGTGETNTSFALIHGVACCRAAGRDLDARDNDPGRFQIRSIVANARSLRWYIDGALCGSYANRNHAIEDRSLLRIGCYLRRGQGPESLFEGDLAELIIYNRCLPDAERRTVEKYLRDKWFIRSPE